MTKSIAAGDIMTKKLVTVSPDDNIYEAIDKLLRNSISGAPVIDKDGQFVGLFTEKFTFNRKNFSRYTS